MTRLPQYFAAVVLMGVLAGCKATPAPVPTQAMNGMAASVGRGDARADSIIMVAKAAMPESVQAQLLELAGKIKVDFVSMMDQLEQNRRDMKLMEGHANAQATEIAVRKAWQDYVDTWWLGPRFWRAIHLVIGIGIGVLALWYALGAFAAWTPLFGGKWIGIGLFLLKWLPISKRFGAAHQKNSVKAGM